jgi:hypothetical protein
MSSTSLQLQSILLSLASQLPLLLVYIIGAILALTQLQRLPRVAPLVTVAFGFLLVLSLAQPFVHSLAMNAIIRTIESVPRGQNYNFISAGLALAFSLLRAIPVALLVLQRRVGAICSGCSL